MGISSELYIKRCISFIKVLENSCSTRPSQRVLWKKIYLAWTRTCRTWKNTYGASRRFDDYTMDDSPVPYFQGLSAGETKTIVKGPGSAWQHTFSLIDAHAVLLEICVTYLYLLGKRSVVGKPSPKVSAFLDYAASSWAKHFHQVCAKILPRNLPYYYGLCHPRFPGFKRWLDASRMPLPVLVGVADDKLQDYLVQNPGLEPGDSWSRRDAEKIAVAWRERMILSSNPTASQNFHFPVKADDTGFVSLDIDEARKMLWNNKESR